jgi:diaminohydroxyphosphoribosylaminopyrimidine deaminase/5-amino-6-(5-phosphoribosylamino)uracil reductase
MTEADELDRRFMAVAIRLGAGGLGTTWPNPSVGAIVVKNGRVVGCGRTAPGGRPHGETLALAEAGAAARGATLYVSLEPCSHHGRTPPCTDAIIAAGVGRIVAAITDPNPLVAGQGFERLRAAGLQVATNVLASEARGAHAGHMSRVSRSRPHVTLKLAVSADGGIGRSGEGQVAITGAIARRHVQALRSRFDAILVGRGTVDADDPELTCRLPGLEGRSPVRVILDSKGRLERDRKIFDGMAPTWVLNAAGLHREQNRVCWMEVEPGPAGLDLHAAMTRLAGEGITRILAEGGARVARALLEADLVDEVLLWRSPVRLGGDPVPALDGLPLAWVEAGERFGRMERRMFGADQMSRYERRD